MAKLTLAITLNLVVVWGSAWAQSNGFGSPRLTVVYQRETGTLHPVDGLSIANRTGQAFTGLPHLDRAVVAHDGSYALGVGDDARLLLVQTPRGGAVASQEVSGLNGPDAMAISPRSQAAVVLRGGRLTVLTSLNLQAARQTADFDVPGVAGTVAVNDAGNLVAVTVPDQQTLCVYDMQAGSAVTLPAGQVTAMQFVANSSDLLFTDGVRNYLVRGATQITLPQAAMDSRPVAVSSTSDGRFYLLADSEGRILRVDATNLNQSTFDCACSVSLLRSGPGYGLFQITGFEHGSMLFLDWNDQPYLFAVHAPSAEVQQ